MQFYSLFLAVPFICLLQSVKTQEKDISICITKETCSTCIQQPGCIWCPLKNTENATITARCLHKSVIPNNWCQNKYMSEENLEVVIEKIPIETAKQKTPVQISPQKIKLHLRRGETHTIKFQYGQAKDYPVDLYYLMDLSASMQVHKQMLSKLGTVLADAMRNLTSDFRLGFGSFVDKVALPFVNTHPARLKAPCRFQGKDCAPPYDFRHHLSLTDDAILFSDQVAKARISGNLDSPEGGFDALIQAMVCTKEIGWRPKARHLLVYSTDAGYHIAGDGKLAGIVEPNDGLCHMEYNEYTHGLIFDYPSISQINEKVVENNVNIIFAIADNSGSQRYTKIYTDLKNKIKESSIGTLSGDSSNVVQIIKDNYDKIVDSIKIFDNFDNIFEIQYHTNCNNKKDENTNECKNLKPGSIVEFSAKIKLLECPKENLTRTYQIRPGALNETLTIEIEMICECPCEAFGNIDFEINSAHCYKSGNLTCGICQCEKGKYGRFCECDGSSSNDAEDTSNCRENANADICSGLGTCKCNKCECNERKDPNEIISGKFCQCNNFACQKNRGQLCSGPEHGNCECGKCNCLEGWTGAACEILNKTDNCIDPNGKGEICSGNGFCENGQCQCEKEENGVRYSGKYCSECISCPTHCNKFTECVKCTVFETENYDEIKCKEKCIMYNIDTIEHIDHNNSIGEHVCTIPIGKCNGIFKFNYDENNDITIIAQKTLNCSEITDIFTIVASVIGSIVLAGLIMLIIWKMVTTVHDRREYAKFENERKNAKWHRAENPLFKNPTSHFNNPMYDSSPENI